MCEPTTHRICEIVKLTCEVMIVFILALALALRLINLNQSLWLDEAVQAITAQKSFNYIFQEIVGDFHPPLYYFLMHFWVRIFGDSEVVLRIPSVLFGVGTVFMLYKITLHLYGRFVAILAAVFLATSQFHIYYSQEARMYSVTCFFATLSMFYFLKTDLEAKESLKLYSLKFKFKSAKLQFQVKNLDYLLYFFASICLIYSDYRGLLVLLAQGVYLLTQRKYKFLIVNTFFLIICYFPWLPMTITQMKTGILATQSLPGWGRLTNVSFLKAIPLTFIKFSLGRITIFNRIIYAVIALIICIIYGSLLLKAVYGWLKDQYKLGNKGSVIILWFFIPLTISWLTSIFIPNYQPFRLLLILPAFYLLLSYGIIQFRESTIRFIISTLIVLINLVSIFVYYKNPYFQRENWRGVVRYLKKQSGAVIILPSETSAWPIKYYDPKSEIKLVTGGGEVKQVEGARVVGNIKEKKIFYIRYLVPLFDPNERILAELEAKDYTKTREISYNQIQVWEYKLLGQQ